MKPVKLVDTNLLERALDAASLRQQVISSNIANVNTEGYDSQRVVFESHLKEVEAVLDGHGIFYDRSETWIESEKLYEVLYSFEMEVANNG